METLIGVVVGGLITATATIGLQLVRSKQETELDLLRRTDDRRIESGRIQRDTLLALQERMTEWINALIAIRLFVDRAEGDEAGLIVIPDDIATREAVAGRAVQYLTQRVLDDSLRRSLEGLTKLGIRSLDASGDRLHLLHEEIDATYTRVLDELGPVLRTYLNWEPVTIDSLRRQNARRSGLDV